MKKQYIFLIMLIIILYLGFKIISSSYREYIITSHIEYIQELNKELKKSIYIANSLVDYKSSDPFIDKMLKEDLRRKNKGEKVIFLTNEKTYNKFTKEIINNEEIINKEIIKTSKNINMSIFQKWIYLIFNKDLSL